MKHRGLKFLSLLLTLVMVLGMLPGMSLTAYAAGSTNVTIDMTQQGYNNAQDVASVSSTDRKVTVVFAKAEGTDNPKYYNSGAAVRLYAKNTMTVSASDPITSITIHFGWGDSKERVISANTGSFNEGYVWTGSANAVTFTVSGNSGHRKIQKLDVVLASSTVAVNNVLISPKTMTLTVGGDPVRVTTFVLPTNATDKKVKWSVGGTNASAVTLYSDANCTAPLALNTAIDTLTAYAKGTAAGSATVTVTSNADATKSASCAVTVSAATYTVTYDANGGSGNMNPTTVSKNDEGKYIYKVESCGFTAPEGETFDYWLGSDGNTYRPGPEVEISGDITLKAQWKEEKKPDSGEKKTSGGGSGFDLVFNIPGEDNSWEYVGGYAPQQAYRVSLAPMQGGSAALGLTTGDSGTQMNVYPSTTVYVFPNAEQGYVLDKIVWSLIDGSASYDITEAKNFVMPAMDVVVYVTFKPVG